MRRTVPLFPTHFHYCPHCGRQGWSRNITWLAQHYCSPVCGDFLDRDDCPCRNERRLDFDLRDYYSWRARAKKRLRKLLERA